MKNLTIYIPLSWQSISSKAFRSIMDLASPQNIDDLRSKYDVEPRVFMNDIFPLDRNRNEGVERMLSSQYNSDIIFWADADQVFPKRCIQRLLEQVSDEFPVVTGLYWRKSPPHYCVVGKYSPLANGLAQKAESLKAMGFVLPDGSQCLYHKPIQDFTTVQPVDVAGMGCLLTKADVFRKIESPWFGYTNPYTNGGDYTVDHGSEEMLLFAKLKKAGIKVLCDPSIRAGHIAERVIGCAEELC